MKAIAFAGWKHNINIQSILRTADMLGFDEVILSGDKFYKGGKKWRQMIAGRKTYKFKIIELGHSGKGLMEYLSERGYTPVCMELSDKSENLVDFTWAENTAIILGHERKGVPQEIMDKCTKVQLPKIGNVNCMNVACAGSIAMYDLISKEVKE